MMSKLNLMCTLCFYEYTKLYVECRYFSYYYHYYLVLMSQIRRNTLQNIHADNYTDIHRYAHYNKMK